MGTITKSVLIRFLNKIPDGYELEYNTLNFDKAVLMFSTDFNKAFLFSKNYRSTSLTHYINELLKESKTIENIYAYHINKGKVSAFDWKNASKDIEYMINHFESENELPEETSIQSIVYNILYNERTINLNSEFKNKNPQFLAKLIANGFSYSDIKNVYQCQRKTQRTLNKIMSDLYIDLIAETYKDSREPFTNIDELNLIKKCLQPYFRSAKENKNLQQTDKMIGFSIDEIPTTEKKFTLD